MLRLRPWTEGDVRGCIRVGIDAQASGFASMRVIYGDDLFSRLRPDWEADQTLAVETWFAKPEAKGWVAEIDGLVAGFIVATAAGAGSLGTVDMLAVLPNHQRRGVGRSLLSKALGALTAAGVPYVEAYIRDFPGHEAALQILSSCGFERRPVQPVPLYRRLENLGELARKPAGVRPIRDSDISDCVRFGVNAFRPVYAAWELAYGPELFPVIAPDWEHSQAAYIESAITNGDDETWVYEVDRAIGGFVVLKMDQHGLADIDLLAVDPTMQGRGIATTLNQFALDRGQEASMSYAIVVTADDDGHAPARRSYANVGFVAMPIHWNVQVARL